MSALRLLFILLVLTLFLFACSRTENTQQSPVFKQIPQIEEIKPEKSPKIKLKRNAKDDYSWEISGDNVDEIIETDKKLRESLGK